MVGQHIFPPLPQSDVERICLRRGQQSHRHRQGDLFPESGPQPHADQEGSAAAGFAVFQSTAEVTGPAAPGLSRRAMLARSFAVSRSSQLLYVPADKIFAEDSRRMIATP